MKVLLLFIAISSSLLCAAVSAFATNHSRRHRQLSLSSVFGSDGAAKKESASSMMMTSSLADEYAIRTQSDRPNELCWDFIPINNFAEKQNNNAGVGTLALKALDSCGHHMAQQERDTMITHSLQCEWSKSSANVWSINVDRTTNETDDGNDFPRELDCVLSRIMVQYALSKITTTTPDSEEEARKGDDTILLHVTLPLPEGLGCQQISLSHENYDDCVRHLFTPLNSEYAQMELVDMVNSNGEVLGSLPRPYVHTFNILHRGIGMIVTNKSIFDTNSNDTGGKLSTPDVYVHQRTSTKRVFPSLYDMFVGGVSTSREDATWTAAREVAEELGLKRALRVLEQGGDNNSLDNPLSNELFQCTICTSYNRCVVSMFAYTCDTSSETIKWQEEEVAWGGWVPYDVVEVAGKLSIDRLKEKQVWPGTGEDDYEDERVTNDESEAKMKDLKSKYNIDEQQERPWESWDFVPDGLLVWVAWLKWVEGNADIL
ncbi:hypothetical protein QTG54_006836 [Skeletonema marinoi]|uniref:Nudix hydrolase domain-containing protein n=1 Tax=Skeletonema marinoi TaxID=267567 RepID=A0AAD9DCA0_9STRA|nr:hypothetical protein QTG54_006836 [Skeletonema marinoi]